MALADVSDWIDEFGRPGAVWLAKRLSANDTLANRTHQAGPYIPKRFLFEIFPDLNRPADNNPDVHFDLYIDSHPDHRRARAVWYNNRNRGKTRDETRLTGFGGSRSPLLDPDSTGTIAVFAFVKTAESAKRECHVWVCEGEGTEADLIEERIGPVEPKQFVYWLPGVSTPQIELFPMVQRGTCWLAPHEIPSDWMATFPSGREIIRKTVEMRPPVGMDADVRLLRRRVCEFEIFRSVEEATYLPRISEGFSTIDGFLGLASTLLQSRKSRSGNSLEYHAIEILEEEGLSRGSDFVHNPSIEGGKRPDFLFPTIDAYQNPGFPAERLRMLAAKTTCKDRWRQILNEADRITHKHLLTLQEGVSVNQFREMSEAKVTLVVPAGLHKAYPEEIRPYLLTVEGFIGDLRAL